MSARPLVLTAVVLAAQPILTACRGHASPADCREMQDHYLDLALRETSGAATMSPAQLEAVREVQRGLKRADPSYRAVEDRCGSIPRSEVSCALGATTTRAWEACVHPADAR